MRRGLAAWIAAAMYTPNVSNGCSSANTSSNASRKAILNGRFGTRSVSWGNHVSMPAS